VYSLVHAANTLCVLQGNIHALKDDITNRAEYALWQQRQVHEASPDRDLPAACSGASSCGESHLQLIIMALA